MLICTATRTLRGSRVGRVQLGFTLIELAVTLALLGILVVLAFPSFSTWIRNAKVRTVADALQNGLRTAQAEALHLNRQSVFSLTNAQPAQNATAVANGKNWYVQYVPVAMDDTTANPPFLQGGALSDVASGVLISSPAGISAVCFNSNGRLVTGDATTTQIPGAVCSAAKTAFSISVTGADRPLQVTVELGGRVRMCDPARPVTAPDGCPL